MKITDSSKPVLSHESQLLLTNATVMKESVDPDCACCSCERMFVRSGVTRVELGEN